jgi:hypothetical protein
MGWQLLNKPEEMRETRNPSMAQAAQDCVATYWQSQAFYPLAFPFTVGPGSVAVMLALSAQAKSLATSERIPAFGGLFVCVCRVECLGVCLLRLCAHCSKEVSCDYRSWRVADHRVFADMHWRADRVARTSLAAVGSETMNAKRSSRQPRVPETWNGNSCSICTECT